MSESAIITHPDYPYAFDASACENCPGRCCNGESGHIWMTKREIEALAEHLEISVSVCAERYLKKVGYRYSIMERVEGENYACLFYDGEKGGCGVYEVRPVQCRTFPFWDYFKTRQGEAVDECPGIITRADNPN